VIHGIGVDIVEVARLARLVNRTRFIERVFTAAEADYCRAGVNVAERFAGRFAAKEAVAKALGIGLPWRDVEILRQASGRPEVVLRGRAAEAAGEGIVLVSISHCHDYAMAQAVHCRATDNDPGRS